MKKFSYMEISAIFGKLSKKFDFFPFNAIFNV